MPDEYVLNETERAALRRYEQQKLVGETLRLFTTMEMALRRAAMIKPLVRACIRCTSSDEVSLVRVLADREGEPRGTRCEYVHVGCLWSGDELV